jgi:hypothetical protein
MRRLVALAAIAGCSFATVRGPGDPPYMQKPECTSSLVAPLGDTVLAAAGITAMLFTLLAWAASDPEKDERGHYKLGYYAIGIVGGPLGGTAFAISGIYGKLKVARCRRAQDSWIPPQPAQAPYDPPVPYAPPYQPPHPDPVPQP